MEAGLQSLLLCADDRVVRVLRRVLSEMEIAVEHCPEADSAVQKLTRQRFEAVIVDCTEPDVANKVLKGTRSAPANRRAITVAILDGETAIAAQDALKRAFSVGSHFVLFKPISLERTRASFRAVRALMKRERRRHARVPIEMVVDILGGGSPISAITVDLGENGMAVKAKGRKLPPGFQVQFTLPGTSIAVESRAEIAWEGGQLLGIRFCDMAPEAHEQLRQWIARQLLGTEVEDPPVRCKLTDLSLNACYLETESPFPVRTRLQLTMTVGDLSVHSDGMVRIMHPASGMGVEFTRNTSVQRARVEDFIRTLVNTSGAAPDIEVKPDAIDNSADAYAFWQLPDDHLDPLISLFRNQTDLPTDGFLTELRKQRSTPVESPVAAAQ